MSQAPSAGFSLPLAAFTAPAFGALSLFKARSANKAVAGVAEDNIERLGEMITQIRADKFRSTINLARQARIDAGAVLSAVPSDAISAREAIADRIARGLASDQFAIDEENRRRVQATRFEQENIKDNANSQMQNPLLAAIEGAIGGAGMGINLDQLLAERAATQRASEAQDTIAPIEQQIRTTQLGTLSATKTAEEAKRDYYQGLSRSLTRQYERFGNPYQKAIKTIFGAAGLK